MDEHLSPTETARRLGTTVKALKVYERMGLVRPMRTTAGWRLYGPAQILRLHEVLALKGLGLALAQIGAVLAGRPSDLDRTLAVQETALRERRREIDQALRRVRQVRARLAAGEALSTEELIAVARETAGRSAHWGQRIADYYLRHLGEAGLARLTPGDPEEWAGLIAELKALTSADVAPDAPAAQDFWRRWAAASHAVSGSDPELNQQAHAAWMEALDDARSAAALPIGRAELDYLARVGSLDG